MTISRHARNLGEYNKAIAAGLGSLCVVVTALLGFTAVLPEAVAGTLATGLALATTVAVFMVKNQDRIDRAGDAVADLLDRR